MLSRQSENASSNHTRETQDEEVIEFKAALISILPRARKEHPRIRAGITGIARRSRRKRIGHTSPNFAVQRYGRMTQRPRREPAFNLAFHRHVRFRASLGDDAYELVRGHDERADDAAIIRMRGPGLRGRGAFY